MPGIDRLYDAYSMTAIPAIGKVVTGDGEPYRYLVESIRTFPDQERFKAMIEAAGFRPRQLSQSLRRDCRHSFGLAHLMLSDFTAGYRLACAGFHAGAP